MIVSANALLYGMLIRVPDFDHLPCLAAFNVATEVVSGAVTGQSRPLRTIPASWPLFCDFKIATSMTLAPEHYRWRCQ